MTLLTSEIPDEQPFDSSDVYADMHMEREKRMAPRTSQLTIAMTIAIDLIERNHELAQENALLQMALDGLKASKKEQS